MLKSELVEPTIENPFVDASIREAVCRPILSNCDNYDPFSRTAQPAILQENSAKNNTPVSADEFQKRQQKLDVKAKELNKKEAQLRYTDFMGERRKNWPPLPENCYCQPCFYQEIEVDIPLEFQNVVRLLYKIWILHSALILINIIGGLILMDSTVIVSGVFYLLLFTPLSYLFWFRPIYRAFRSDSSCNFMIFFFSFSVQFIFTVFQATGTESSGTIGLIKAVNTLKHSNFMGLFAIIVAGCYIFAAIADFIMLTKIHKIYRSSGNSISKAREEFASEVFRSEPLKRTVSELADIHIHNTK